MKRRELAKELRNFREGELRSPPLSTPQWRRFTGLLDRIAAALEDEDRNARRYWVLKEAVENDYCDAMSFKIWCIKGVSGDNDPVIFTSTNRECYEHPTLDAAIDAWIEEHADGPK